VFGNYFCERAKGCAAHGKRRKQYANNKTFSHGVRVSSEQLRRPINHRRTSTDVSAIGFREKVGFTAFFTFRENIVRVWLRCSTCATCAQRTCPVGGAARHFHDNRETEKHDTTGITWFAGRTVNTYDRANTVRVATFVSKLKSVVRTRERAIRRRIYRLVRKRAWK